MNRRVPVPPPALSWLAAAFVLALVLVPAGVSAAGARGRAADALASLGDVQRDAAVILASDRSTATGSSAGLAEAVIAAMARAGLDRGALDALTPDAGRHVASGLVSNEPSAVRARATLAVRCTLPELGRLLEALPELALGWTPTAVEITPARAPAQPTASGPLPLRVVITLEGVFAEGTGA